MPKGRRPRPANRHGRGATVFHRLQPQLPALAALPPVEALARRHGAAPGRRRFRDGAEAARRAGRADAGHHPLAPRRAAAPARPAAGQAADMLRMLTGGTATAAAAPRAQRLSGDRLRARPQCLDLCGTGRRLHPGRAGLGGDGRHQRAERPAAWRRAGPGARHARRDRRGRQGGSLAAAGIWRAASG